MFIIYVGIMVLFVIAAISKLDKTIRNEAKKTRKDVQEVKTAQRQVRKDLNNIETTVNGNELKLITLIQKKKVVLTKSKKRK